MLPAQHGLVLGKFVWFGIGSVYFVVLSQGTGRDPTCPTPISTPITITIPITIPTTIPITIPITSIEY